MKLFAKTFTVVCLLACTQAQGQECLRLLDSLNALIDQGEFQIVETMIGHVDTLCLREVGDRDSLYGDVLAIHGVVLMVKGNSADALAFFRRAKEISLRTRGLYEKAPGRFTPPRDLRFLKQGNP